MNQVTFKTDLTLDHIAEAKGELEKAFEKSRVDHSSMEIDLSHVTECDASGLQLLLSLLKSADALSIKVILKGLSSSMIGILERYQLSQRFILVKE